jgi:hypothetical protein
MTRMRRFVPALVVLVVATASVGAESDPRAHEVATQLVQAMGGRDHWNQMGFLRFDWVVEQEGHEVARARHLWDHKSGRDRVEWKTRDGQQVQAIVDLASRQGRVWVDGQLVSGADSASWLEKAYGRFINDSYWLLMPWKIEDPGTHLEYAGEAVLNGDTYDILHLHFDADVGLTPGDQYWAYVNRATHRMDRWAYFLQSMEGEPSLDHATVWSWTDWRSMDGMWMSSDRVQVGGEGNRRIYFPVLGVLSKVDPRVFESVETPMPEPAN